jgi:3',5'-cyclic AMP phosphodiesterase CpdA
MQMSRRLRAWFAALAATSLLVSCGDDLALRGDPTRPSWSIVVLPDTQYYAITYPQVFASQLAWVRRSAESLNLQLVVHVGDVTETDGAAEWQVARRSFDKIEGTVPYLIVPGNHDYSRGARRRSHLSDWFPAEALRQQPTFGGLFEPTKIDNSYQLFTIGRERWLVLGLEWGPRDEALEWANRVIDEHPEHQVILVTHAYLYNDGQRYDWAKRGHRQRATPRGYADDPRWPLASELNDGQEIWDKLIARHSSIKLVLCGHVPQRGVARLTSELPGGGQVHQLLADYQDKSIGGGGYLRILRFYDDEIEVRTYSPFLDQELSTPSEQFALPR